MHPDRVIVVVPTFNERDNLPDLAASVLLHGYRLIVVDDNSPDGTGAIAEELSDATPGMEVIHRPMKLGLGPAYGDGFTRAMSLDPDVIVQMDCDFSHSPADIPRLVAATEAGADLALGSRYVPGGGTPDWPRGRRLLSKGGNLYARFALGIPIRDATGGFRAWKNEALASLPFAEAEASGYGFQVEMAMRASDQGLKVVEVPIIFRDRLKGHSKMGRNIVIEAMRLVTVWGLKRRTAWLRSRR
ncbi:MAG TPA: polyprenol monophosphomannose synthase [Acidimicrobiia bacterium]